MAKKVLKLNLSDGTSVDSNPFDLVSTQEVTSIVDQKTENFYSPTNPPPVPLDSIWLVNEVKIFTDNTNPNVKYPTGTFVKVAQGRTLIGADSSHALGSTGGSADAVVVEHSHNFEVTLGDKLSIAYNYPTLNVQGTAHNYPSIGTMADYDAGGNITLTNAGVSGTGKNMQPYLVVNYWQRVS